MTVFTQIFGGDNIAPSSVSYASVTLSVAITEFSWPVETSAGTRVVATIMDVSSNSNGYVLRLPPANEVSSGQTILFNNTGANSFIVQDNAGVQVLNATAGQTWQIYLTNNTTAAGTWRAFQYGAAVSAVNAASLAGTGIIALGSLLSQSMPTLSYSASHTVTVPDRANTFIWTGGTGTFTLPIASPSSAINNWFVQFKNAGSGVLSIAATSLVDGYAAVTLQPLDSCIVVSDGSTYYTLGLGQSAVFAFDYTVIDVSGIGDYILTGAELNRVAYEFTGVLTGPRNIIVPNTIQQYWVTNNTTGAFPLAVKTATTSGVTITQTASAILYCNGNQVVPAESGGISIPIPIALGGTGATNAPQALINLGLDPIDGGTF
jgi:hypothetical protein